MSKSNKRQRLEEETPLQIKARSDKAVGVFFDDLDAIESSDPSQASGLVTKASSTLLQIKSIQRDILQEIQKATKAMEAKQSQVKKQSMLLDSLEYEKASLRRQIENDFPTPHLERMCREETMEEDHSQTDIEQVMNAFLCGSPEVSYEDAAQYKTVIAKLHQEINLRGSLERDVTQAQKELTEKKKALEQKQQFLNDLPKKLEQMERASLPLQRFFETSNLVDVSMIGTERTKRLDLARSLPGPLYTLFVQLQSHLDASAEPDVTVSVVEKQVSTGDKDDDAAWFQPDSHTVQLHLPLPDHHDAAAVGRKRKKVTIEFVYLPKLRIVTAQASGCPLDKVNLSSLLVHLFPGDDGKVQWTADTVHLESMASTHMPGRPYHWCNYLSGIHLPPSSASLDPLSTKAIMKELMRRLKANVTLAHILSTLEKKKPNPIPVHPAWSDAAKETTSTTAKLMGWASTECTEANKKSFVATLRRKTSSIKATVTLDPCRYPSVPPKWSLTTGGESWGEKHGTVDSLQSGTNPLYDNGLGAMERVVNVDLHELVTKNVDDTYDWILAHQLHRIIQLWDESQRTMEH